MPQQRLHIAVITIHTPHYENVPFEIPEGWAWTTLGDLLNMQAGKNISANEIQSEKNEQTKYACYGGNGVRGFVTDYNTTGKHAIIGRQGALCGNINVAEGCFYATEHTVVVDVFGGTDTDWCIYMLEQLNLNQYATATAQPGLSVNKIAEVLVPVPPQAEQKRISQVIQKWLNTLALIEGNKTTLNAAIINAKSKILDLAIHGKLVPQDPNDEPAIELLKRINPDFTPCDNGHYPNLPKGWAICHLDSVVHIVNGKSQKDVEVSNGKYPIYGSGGIIGRANDYLCLAGSTIIGRKGTINSPIFVSENFWNIDTAFGMKPLDGINDIYFYYFCQLFDFSSLDKSTALPSLTKRTIGNIELPIPPYNEQQRIVDAINRAFQQLDTITESL